MISCQWFPTCSLRIVKACFSTRGKSRNLFVERKFSNSTLQGLERTKLFKNQYCVYLNCLFQQYIVGHDQFYSFQFKFNFPFQFINFNKKYKSICVNQFVHVIFKYSGKYKKQQHIFNPFKPPPSKEITYEKTPRTLSKGCKRNVNDSQKCCL